MALTIKWTKTASNNLDQTVNFLLNNWNETTAKKFVSKVDQIIHLISAYPEIGNVEVKDKNIRGFLVSPQTSIFISCHE